MRAETAQTFRRMAADALARSREKARQSDCASAVGDRVVARLTAESAGRWRGTAFRELETVYDARGGQP